MKAWKRFKLYELLDYEQPSAYIVNSTQYDDSYPTPVLTAGKSFILGYTNETRGICTKHPAIIFDDFTTDTKYVNFDFKVKSSAMKILHPIKSLVLPKFIYYRLQIINFDHSTHKRYWIQQYSKQEVEIPSLAEQQRIVAKIEELFSELDNSVAALKQTKAQLSVYRQAVISSAFPILSPQNQVRLIDVADVSSGITKGRKISGNDVISLPYLRVANVQSGFLDLSEVKEIDVKTSEIERFLLRENDVLYTEGGDRDKLGRGTVWKNELPQCVHQNHVFKARANQAKVLPLYLAYWSMSTYARNYFYEKGKQSVNLASINKTVLSNLPIPLPSLKKQKEIIQFIDSAISTSSDIKKTINKTLRQAESLRQSILKQAFEGKLV